MGSKELLLYEINDCVIKPPTSKNWEEMQFSGFSKAEKIQKLNLTTPDLFQDALLMVGTSFLPPFPPLQDSSITTKQPFSLIDAANLLRTSEKSVTSACVHFNDILQTRDPKWLDKYRKAKMAVKHCHTVTLDGRIQIRDYEHLTSDHVEYLGLQLPPELYHYLSRALVGPRIMNCFAHLEFVVFPTLDGVTSDEYKKLVTRSLVPLKETTAALISSRIHRGFQYRDLNMRFWFDDSLKHTLVHRNMQPQTNNQADTWGVHDPQLTARATATGTSAGHFSFALLALESKDFASTTITKDKVVNLKSVAEVSSNALWRLLHLRGYINDQHELTAWGRALAMVLKSIRPIVKQYNDKQHAEEAAFLAIELIRFDNLNSRNRHPELVGGPLRGSDVEKASCILIGRTACLLKVRHQNIGYTGPLSKNFLAYHSIINAVRETDRDLLEAVTASMFLNSQADKEMVDLERLGRRLVLLRCGDIWC